MKYLYSFGIFFYVFSVKIAALFNSKAKQWIEGRKLQILHSDDLPIRKSILFHCASVGEFEQALPLIDQVQRQSDFTIQVSFFSPSGYDFAKAKYPNLNIYYLPWDFNNSMNSFFTKLNPSAVILIKYELWNNMLQVLNSKNIPVFLVSGIFRKDQIYFKWYGKIVQDVLLRIRYFFLQDEESKKLLQQLGISNSIVSGDTRFDRVLAIKNSNFTDQKIIDFVQNSNIFVAGSIWPSDYSTILKIIQLLPSDYKIIIAPHELEQFDAFWLGESCNFYTKNEAKDSRILILDTMGLLAKCYRFASFSYVGGGFGAGLHNTLEPAVYEKPIFIGASFSKFNEAVEMVKLGVVFSLQKDEDIQKYVSKAIHNMTFQQEIMFKLKQYIASNTNVSEKIVVSILKQLRENQEN